MLKILRGNVDSTSERKYQTFNKIWAKSSFGRHEGGQEYALKHDGQYKQYYFVEKLKCHKISPLNAFSFKFWVKDNFYVLRQFLASALIPTHCLKEASVSDLLVQVAYWPLLFEA